MPSHKTARFYIVPLAATGSGATAHVFAFGQHGRTCRDLVELRQLVLGFGAPWQVPQQLTPVAETGLLQVSGELLFADDLATHHWVSDQAVEHFAARHQDSWLCGTPSEQWFREPRTFPVPWDELWGSGRALLLVDLDQRRMGQAAALALEMLPDVLRPPGSFEAHLEAGQAQEWDRVVGGFLTPEESRARWSSQRNKQRTRIGRRHVFRPRLPFLRRELEYRVDNEHGPRSVDEALNEELIRGFHADAVRECASRYLSATSDAAREYPENPVQAVRRALPGALAEFRRDLRRVLSAYLSDAIYPGARRDNERAVELLETDAVTNEVGDGSRFLDQVADSRTEDAFLDRLVVEETDTRLRMRLTPAETEVYESCMLGGEPAVEYAIRLNRNPGTVRKQVFEIRRKAKDLFDQDNAP